MANFTHPTHVIKLKQYKTVNVTFQLRKHVVANLFHSIQCVSNVKHIVAMSLHTIPDQNETYCFYFVTHYTIPLILKYIAN